MLENTIRTETDYVSKIISYNSTIEDKPKETKYILIVDDELDIREMVSRMLNSQGYECIETAKDGLEGLKKLNQDPDKYGAVITDLTMPGMDGHGLIGKIREDEQTKDIPVIVVSANVTEFQTIKDKRRGVVTVAKPYLIGDLINAVEQAVKDQPYSLK